MSAGAATGSRHRCSAEGCRRFASRGRFCSSHSDQAQAEAKRGAADRFRARLTAGTYTDLFGDQVAGIIADAAERNGVEEEIGALRVVLARLVSDMLEADDPARLAGVIARVAATNVQALRARRLLAGGAADDLTDAISTILLEFENAA